ncbi:DUF2971 domain-containing protein [Sphingobium sp. LSP13-1-1.1]|uniref:DUF2971 domain-containing protein n=1 Tax=Sphingobium sp. LSP13-1-1.1 TaxID=3135234 RepID=UPI00342107EE
MTIPAKLYKYCPVGPYSLRAIVHAEVNHCAPSLFNDPLDCNPTLQIDNGPDELINLLRVMRSHEDTPSFENRISALYFLAGSADLPEQREQNFCRLISREILQGLQEDLGQRGVLSLSKNWDKPLMWSHYADQHKGICIEYSTKNHNFPNLGKVNYNSRRSISANDLYRWKVRGDKAAAKRVYNTYFFSKAPEWGYEEEWRDIADKAGVHHREFEITAIYFGIRTDPVWESAIVKMLNKDRDIKLFKVSPGEEHFELLADEVDRQKIEEQGIAQPNRAIIDMLNKKPSRVVELDKQQSAAGSVLAGLARLGDPMFTIPDPLLTGSASGAASRAITQALAGSTVIRPDGIESHAAKAIRQAVEGFGTQMKHEDNASRILREAVEGHAAKLKTETTAERLLREAVGDVAKGKKGKAQF